MKGNQGLEALAALCGGQTDALTEESRAGNRVGAQSGDSASLMSNQQSQPSQDPARQTGKMHGQVPTQQSPLQNVTPQQWGQAIAAAAALQGGGVNPSLAAQSLLLAGLPPSQHLGDNSFSTMKQLAYHQYVQAQANLSAQQAAQSLASGGKGAFGDQSQQALIMALAGGKANAFSNIHGTDLLKQTPQQVIPSASTPSNHLSHADAAPNPAPAPTTSTASITSSPVLTSMKPPPPPSQGVQSTLSTAGIQSMLGQTPPKIAPMPGGKVLPNQEGAAASSLNSALDDKKQLKRAANRRSAQLSRKRKKQFIEELKEENDELRRKEQILRSIPDLIVVFDSSGKLGFVSQSVSRFIDMTPEELEGTSFWDRLCEDSVRLLKAAFMDSLAARKPDAETAALGSGVWELRLVDKHSNYSIVTLNGVVHFSGEAPECVCCIRPRDQQPILKLSKEIKKPTARPVSSCDGSRSSQGSTRDLLEIRANPNQSVISNDTSADDSGTNSESRKKPRKEGADVRSADGEVVRISDGDSVGVSSASDDGITSN